jgi:protease-4
VQKHLIFITSLITSQWLLDEATAMQMAPIVMRLVDGDMKAMRELKQEDSFPDIAARVSIATQSGAIFSAKSISEAGPGSVAIIPVKGIMMQDDQFCGPVGTATLGQWVKEANANSNIDAIVIHGNTPGGQVMGTETFGNTLKNSAKPIVWFADNITGSAGYWAASQTKHIMASGKTTLVGSIGTKMEVLDITEALAKAGAKIHTVTATDSPDKNKSWEDMLAGKYETIRAEYLDALNSVFREAVQTGRGDKLKMVGKEPLTGKMYPAEAAINTGLVDSIGSMADAIDKARSLVGGFYV